MHLSTLKRHLRARFREQGLDFPKPFTLEVVWWASVLTSNGEKPPISEGAWETCVASADPRKFPWAKRLQGLKPNEKRPRVMVLGRRGSNAMLLKSGFAERNAEKQGLKNFRVHCCNRLSSFWENFFDSDRFLTRKVDIPALIVSPGHSSFYDGAMDNQVDVKEFLEAIGREWGIPVAVMSP